VSGRTVRCSQCGALVEEPAGIEDRQLCPTCGSLARTFGVTLNDSAEVHDSTRLKARQGDVGKVRPYVESLHGADYHRDSGEWRQVSRVVDRDCRWYTERILDAQGNVVREVSEPLSEHTGRGAAKPRPPKPPEA
jgi:phage FluMu protein Com